MTNIDLVKTDEPGLYDGRLLTGLLSIHDRMLIGTDDKEPLDADKADDLVAETAERFERTHNAVVFHNVQRKMGLETQVKFRIFVPHYADVDEIERKFNRELSELNHQLHHL